ncbi:MAG: AraD1 family protein [Caulobacteraceae bacterium]
MHVAAIQDDGQARVVREANSTYDLAMEAIRTGSTLAALIERKGLGEVVDIDAALIEGRVIPPVLHPDPAHMLISGTGLTHLGSAKSRDDMHRKLSEPATLTDSMKMFKIGLVGGKPPAGQVGAPPEWFYKGDGSILSAPGEDLRSPDFAADAGDEAEIVGVYVIAPDGRPVRLGFALGNELSDHVIERENYLYLAHSKLRPCSIGPELLVGDLPQDVHGTSRIWRGSQLLWESAFLSGEAHMSHTIANLEHHHFKYDLFRRPGDVHLHFFGAATLSFSEGVKAEPGDMFEIEADAFLHPLRNRLRIAATAPAPVQAL